MTAILALANYGIHFMAFAKWYICFNFSHNESKSLKSLYPEPVNIYTSFLAKMGSNKSTDLACPSTQLFNM
jgi:hypothetical protein